MTNTKKKKNKKWVLAAALLLAGVIAVGGTFAWFTSQDEVTNRLTASNSYGVSVTESFTPPEQWTPGQNIEKEVAAVNTGNVAAYVRLNLTDEMLVTAETTVSQYSLGSGIASTVTAANGYVVLTEDEVISLEAGGQLVYMSNLQKVVTVVTDAATSAETTIVTYQLKDGTAVDTTVTAGEFYKTITTSGLYVFERTELDGSTTYVGYYVAVDGSDKTFYKVDVSGITLSEVYSSESTSTTYTADDTKTTTYDISRGDFNFVKEETTALAADSSSLLFSYVIFKSGTSYTSGVTPYGDGYVSTGTVYYIQAVYDPDYQETTFDTANGWESNKPTTYLRTYTNGGTKYYYNDIDESNNIIINIALDGEWTKTSGSPDYWTSTNWTAVYDEDVWTFYYNHVLSAGTTSDLLVTDMQLDTSVTNDAYTEFTYDLIVGLDSVQVVAAETYENSITMIETPSSSITWTQAVSGSTYDVSETTTDGYQIYSNENGQVCTSKGDTSATYGSSHNYLTWSFSTQ